MLAWLHPIALLGVLAALGPIAVHLLRRQRANRLPFASVRFVRAASTAAVRLRLPSDIALLLIRVAIVAGAAAALAQPIFVGQARRALWDGRLSRAIVVDVSESMKSVSQRALEAANAEATGVDHAVRVEAERLADGFARAVEALAIAPPSRREIVVVSDFQNGSITPADIESVPQQIGLRFVKVADPPMAIEFGGDVSASAPGVGPRVQRVQATREGTRVRLTPVEATTAGLRLIDAGPAGDGLLRAVARAGAPAPSVEQPITLAFLANPSKHADSSENARDLTSRTTLSAWMLRTVVLMRRDPVLSDAAREHSARGDASRISGLVVARNAKGIPVVVARADGAQLLLTVAAGQLDYVSATTLRSALIARRGEPAWQEHETLPIPAARLAGWVRDPAPITTEWHELSDRAPGDARWVWLVVLLLLAIETIARRRRSGREGAVYADAA